MAGHTYKGGYRCACSAGKADGAGASFHPPPRAAPARAEVLSVLPHVLRHVSNFLGQQRHCSSTHAPPAPPGYVWTACPTLRESAPVVQRQERRRRSRGKGRLTLHLRRPGVTRKPLKVSPHLLPPLRQPLSPGHQLCAKVLQQGQR